MKKQVLTTTEFYKNPSKAINFVKEGGTVYLGYKGLKNPIAVISAFEENKELKTQNIISDNIISWLKKNSLKTKTNLDTANLIRNLRDER